MASELLNVAKVSADLGDLPGRAYDEGPTAAMTEAADHAEACEEAMEPDRYGAAERPRSRSL
jgi:hypothetical protein